MEMSSAMPSVETIFAWLSSTIIAARQYWSKSQITAEKPWAPQYDYIAVNISELKESFILKEFFTWVEKKLTLAHLKVW